MVAKYPCSFLTKLFCQPDEQPFGTADIAESIGVFVLNDFADKLRAAIAEPREQLVEVINGEHDAQVAKSIYGSIAVIGDYRRPEKSGEFEPAVAVGCDHHGDLDLLVAKSGDAPSPFSFDHSVAFQLQAEFNEKRNGLI